MIAAMALMVAAQSPTICADRPSKANSACTVPTGHWQLEVSAIDWTLTRDGGARSDVTSLGQTLVKLGVGDNSDIELLAPAYVHVRERDAASTAHNSGFGDTIIRFKRRLTSVSAAMPAAVIPFLKLPTASRAIGNGKAEGGIAIPLSFTTTAGSTITIGPEVDVIADADSHGYHAGLTNLVNLGISPLPRLSVSAELWNSMNFDPDKTVRLWSADFSGAYLPTNRIQFDGGANLGLNRATAGIELYAGASVLF